MRSIKDAMEKNHMAKRGFGELELAVLHVLKSGAKMTVKEMCKALGGQNKYTTIMTVMLRLTQKKILNREQVGNHFEYWLASSEEKTSSLIDRIKIKLFGIKPIELISYLVESPEELSDEELLQMEKMVEKAKQARKK